MSIRRMIPWLAGVSALVVASQAPASSQCLDWKSGFGPVGAGMDGSVRAMIVFDDGSGPALYAGGDFRSAGGSIAGGVARWNGSTWTGLGQQLALTGFGSYFAVVRALAVFDDGNGPALYAGGNFGIPGYAGSPNIAKWNGTSWVPLGAGLGQGDDVEALAAFDDGSGPKLYAGGNFTNSGPAFMPYIGRWDGTSWSQVPGAEFPRVHAMTVFDDGHGPKLYVGGDGTLMKWTPSGWLGIGGATIYSLGVFDDGSGAALHAGGLFTNISGTSASNIARWNGSTWSPLGAGTSGAVEALVSFDDGTGASLYVGGEFTTAGGSSANHIAKWKNGAWSSLASGVTYDTAGAVYSLCAFAAGGNALYVGGLFNDAGGTAVSHIGKWSGSSWSALGPMGAGITTIVYALGVYDDGNGDALYAGGEFFHAGSADVSRIAKWDGTSWSPLSSGVSGGTSTAVAALAAFDDGTGPALYVGGVFTTAGGIAANGIARWNGSTWSNVGGGVAGNVSALLVFDDGSGAALYAGGGFMAAGGVPASHVAKWDGTQWSPLGVGVGPTYHGVGSLAAFDDGSGLALVAAGNFYEADGAPANYIAKWNGSNWSPLGSGTETDVFSLAVFDDGSGPKLYAGGRFQAAGGSPAYRIAKWDGVSWSSVGGGLDPQTNNYNLYVSDLIVFDDGSGSALYVGGRFNNAGSVPAKAIARWNGTTWSALGAGIEDGGLGYSPVRAFAVYDDHSSAGPDLYAAGQFFGAGGAAASCIAEWRGCAGPGTLYCFGDGSAAPCPCNNSGQPQHGCDNSAATGGALLASAGHTNPDTVVLAVTKELPSALSIFLQGNATIAPTVFGDGLRCAGGSLKRLYVKNASGGVVFVPQPGDPSITTRSAQLGDTIAPGSLRYYQTYYRDPNQAFCPMPQGNTWNVTNGARIQW